MNTKLLRRVAKHISEEPKRLAMGLWIQRKDDSYSGDGLVYEHYHQDGQFSNRATKHRFAQCGTAGCIAGWAVLLKHGVTKAGKICDVPVEAAKILDIEDCGRLFYVDDWPEEFSLPYLSAHTPAKRARIAVARIEHFIKTKGAE